MSPSLPLVLVTEGSDPVPLQWLHTQARVIEISHADLTFDQHLAEAGVSVRPSLESNSMIVLFSHIRTGKWASIMPLNLAETLGFAEPIRAIPIVEPDASHLVGLVAAAREPRSPLAAAFLDQMGAMASTFEAGAIV